MKLSAIATHGTLLCGVTASTCRVALFAALLCQTCQ